ncbi:VWA domain-containing protein [Dactylosporangium siamense]|uniref:VWA domain-containing protein n=1 Tax=Dactylosporangium siamense TaxID=685454 RepID=UPI00194227F0|nr:VWA domain-containing protein [Dactylosporangium siamense]
MSDDQSALALLVLSGRAGSPGSDAALAMCNDRAAVAGVTISRVVALDVSDPRWMEADRVSYVFGGQPFPAVVVYFDPLVTVVPDQLRLILRSWVNAGSHLLVPFGKLSANEVRQRLLGDSLPVPPGLPPALLTAIPDPDDADIDLLPPSPPRQRRLHRIAPPPPMAPPPSLPPVDPPPPPPLPMAPPPVYDRRAVSPQPLRIAPGPADRIWGNQMAVGSRQAQSAAPSWEPMREPRSGPLPHDGLFVRRNNAFGTRSTVSIRDLINNGVLIEQTQVRFDDFVSDDGGVPLPLPGQALSVSYGATPVAGDAKAEPASTHFVEIALRAGDEPPAGRGLQEQLPVNFVFVVDVSASMGGQKLDMVKMAVRELYRKLRPDDILGIVTFSTSAATVLPATPRRLLSEEDFAARVGGMRASGGTDLNLGLQYGIAEIRRHHDDGGHGAVSCVYLFSDGEPNSGESNWINIRHNAAGQLRGDVTLSCFGFGTDARMGELDALAGLAGGHSTFVTDPMDVRLSLDEDLQRRDLLAAMNIQLRIDLDPDVTLWRVYGHDLVDEPAARQAILRDADDLRERARDRYGVSPVQHLIDTEGGVRIFAPDLAFGETYWVVLEVQIPPGGDASFGDATVQYADTVAHEPVRRSLQLSGSGSLTAETVLAHGIGLWTSEVTFAALDDLHASDRATATTRIQRHIDSLRMVHRTVPLPQFRDDQVTLTKFLSLAGNLGRVQMTSDSGGQYMIHSMSEFGRVRSGLLRGTSTV